MLFVRYTDAELRDLCSEGAGAAPASPKRTTLAEPKYGAVGAPAKLPESLARALAEMDTQNEAKRQKLANRGA